MNKKMRALLEQRGIKIEEMRVFMTKETLTEDEKRSFDAVSVEVTEIDADYAREERMFNLTKEEIKIPEGGPEKRTDEDAKLEYRGVFFKALRKEELTEDEQRTLSSNTDADGKLLIPQDIQTSVKELVRNHVDVYNLVNVERVGTKSGRRVIEKDAEITPLGGVAELTTIPELETPQFLPIDFDCQDFKGLISMPNSLIKDENAALESYLKKWLAKKVIATHNSLIFYADGTKVDGILGITDGGFTIETAVAVVGIKGFKQVFNKKLPTAIAKNSKIVTNQTGFDYLDNLEDKNGRAYLQPDPTDTTKYKFLGRQVVVFDDVVLANDGSGNAPFICGNFKEAYTYFDRENMSLATSKEAGFEDDSTKVRVIVRGDGKIVDKKALYVLYTPVEVVA